MQLCSQNIVFRSHTTHLTGFVNLHTYWFQCHCDLYRFVIPNIRESVADDALRATPHQYVDHCQRTCLGSAIGLLRFWSDLYHLDGEKPLNHSSFGICAYQCLKIIQNLSHLLPDDGKDSLVELSQDMWKVFEMLTKVQYAYPIITNCVREFCFSHQLLHPLIPT